MTQLPSTLMELSPARRGPAARSRNQYCGVCGKRKIPCLRHSHAFPARVCATAVKFVDRDIDSLDERSGAGRRARMADVGLGAAQVQRMRKRAFAEERREGLRFCLVLGGMTAAVRLQVTDGCGIDAGLRIGMMEGGLIAPESTAEASIPPPPAMPMPL